MIKIKYQNKKTGEIAKEMTLLPTQERFYNSKARYPLFSGGFGCGKSMVLILKVLHHLSYPRNYGLIGRVRYQELKDSVLQQFFELCPSSFIKKQNKAELRVYFKNGSQLIFRHLDNIAENEIKSMNLGFFAIDQAEDVPENIFLALRGRLRRNIISPKGKDKYVHQGMMTCNPALTWLFKIYKQNPSPEYELIEGNTLDNKANLPKSQIEDLLKYPEKWKRQYVYGIWDEFISEKNYFPIEYIQEQQMIKRPKIRDFEGFTIYENASPEEEYQIGVDPANMGEDSSAIVVVSKTTGHNVASWKGKIPADSLAGQIIKIARIYRDAKVIIEMNGLGLATLVKLKEGYSNIYKREVFDRSAKKKIEKYGWMTSYSNKILLFDNLLKLLRENRIKLNDERIMEEMKTFVWTDEVMKKGLGAQAGSSFHDDLCIAVALAYWGVYSEENLALADNLEPPRGSVAGTLREIQNRNRNDFIGNEF